MEQKLRNFSASDLEQVTAKLLEEFQRVKVGRKNSIKFASGLSQVFYENAKGRNEECCRMNLEQVYHKAFVRESKMFEVNFDRRCTNKFS